MSSYETLIWEFEDHVATVTLNRPEKKNAISWAMFAEIKKAFEAADEDPEVRCVVITGAGDSFCSGADLSDPSAMVSSAFELKDRMRYVHEVARSVTTCSKPVIAKVTGVAAGAGCNLALSCDLVVASNEASFVEIFVRRGLVTDFGGSWALTRLLPLNRAKEMALLGRPVAAEEANELGLLNRLCDASEVDAVVAELAGEVAGLPPRTVSLIKENLNRAHERSFEENLEAEATAQALTFTSEDTREAVIAFLEKRQPRFTGR